MKQSVVHRGVVKLQQQLWYALFIATLAIFSGVLLAYELWGNASSERILLLRDIDLWIASIFLLDFFAGLIFPQTTRGAYWRQNWINFIASLPITNEMSQVLRLLRLIRVVRVIRAALEVRFATKRYQAIRKKGTSKLK